MDFETEWAARRRRQARRDAAIEFAKDVLAVVGLFSILLAMMYAPDILVWWRS